MNSYQHLTYEERYMIYRLQAQKISMRNIAVSLGRSASTVLRELKRNRGNRGYRYKQAHSKTLDRRRSSHRHVIITNKTRSLVKSYLRMDWSPEQVSNYLHLEHSLDISTETIYKMIWSDKVHGGDLYSHLRQFRKKRRKRYGTGYNYRGHIKNRISIDERPDIVDKRERIGDWEIDTIIGKNHKGALVTIVERKSRYTVIAKVGNRKSELVAAKTLKLLTPFKDRVFTITGDNGKEFADHEEIAENLDTAFYFAHPYSSWERGLNENTNGLIRQYVPKGSDLSLITDNKVTMIMDHLNQRPRKSLDYKTPEEIFLKEIGLSSSHGKRIGQKNNNKNNSCAVAVTN